MAPDEERDLRDIEKAIGRRLPRVTVPDFDYTAVPDGKLEIPRAQRIAEIRARKREERQRAEANAARRGAALRGRGRAPQSSAGGPPAPGGPPQSRRPSGPSRFRGRR